MMGKKISAAWLDAYKRERGCIDCGTKEGRLDFDHRDKTTKLFRVSQWRDRHLWTILPEIAKCDVRCAPCHTKRHWAEGEKKPPNGTKRPPCECGKPSHARGMCLKHYTRWKRHGSPDVVYRAWELRHASATTEVSPQGQE
jgi:hypothetical protein